MDKNITPLPWIGEDDRITAQGGRLLASVWSRRVHDDQEPGESWLAMRERTQPERDAATAEMQANAAFIVKAVNMHGQLVAALDMLLDDIEEHRGIAYTTFDAEDMARAALSAAEGK